MVNEGQIEEYSDDEYSEDTVCEELEEARRNALFSIAQALLPKRAEAIQFRGASGVEERWREDEMFFEGLDGANPARMVDVATGTSYRSGDKEQQPRSSVVVNIIRGRCETAEGRFSDIQLPVSGKNWKLEPTPVPELSEQLKDTRPAMQGGQPITDQTGKKKTMSDIAKDKKERAEEAMAGMETEIEDQLVECDYNSEQRKVIRSSIRLGVGILKGPVIVKPVGHRWQKEVNEETRASVYTATIEEDGKPASVCVNPWNVYPSPGAGEDIQRTAEYIWERDTILPRDVRNLIGLDGYFEDQLILALSELPKRTLAAQDGNEANKQETLKRGSAYEKWEYHGDLSREDLEAVGVECGLNESQAFTVCVVFINDRPVKVVLNPVETGELPYDFWQWTVVNSDDPWGIGIPRMMIWLQRIITAAWRAMLDNAGDSSGANIVTLPGVKRADGKSHIGGKALWYADTTDLDDARKAFAQFQITNNQTELQNIIELALRFVDLETSLPTIFQGETQTAPETLGATNIMVDSANVGLRQRVKLYDDRITRPHIKRYYHYNMFHSDKEEIKGDYNVDAIGTSSLLEKDQHAQTLLQIFQLKGDPDINRITDWEKAARQFYESRNLDLLKSDDDLAKAKEAESNPEAQPVTPAVQAATIRTEGDLAKEKLRQESDMAELQFKAEQAELERQHDKTLKEMDLQMKMMEYDEKRNMGLDKLKVQLALGSEGLNLQREQGGKPSPSVPEVTEPPIEPPQQAPDGQSFQQ
jgi:hypothetical protein